MEALARSHAPFRRIRGAGPPLRLAGKSSAKTKIEASFSHWTVAGPEEHRAEVSRVPIASRRPPAHRRAMGTETPASLRVVPDPGDPRLTRPVTGRDARGAPVDLRVVEERPLTIYLNSREIVTAMTIGDHPEWLALGFLTNQGMVRAEDEVTGIDYDAETEAVVVRTALETDHEAKLARATRTSGCAVGTVFGDMMEGLEGLTLPSTPLRVSDLMALSAAISRTPSLYLEAGAIHGTCLCAGADPLAYFEDVGRHNAVDKLAGWMRAEGVAAADKTLYTTGRLTSEMVIKCALMGIPSLVSRSGFTAWGVEIARQVGLTVIGRLKGSRFVCLSGEDRVVWDATAEARPG
jgi:FdhD protein